MLALQIFVALLLWRLICRFSVVKHLWNPEPPPDEDERRLADRIAHLQREAKANNSIDTFVKHAKIKRLLLVLEPRLEASRAQRAPTLTRRILFYGGRFVFENMIVFAIVLYGWSTPILVFDPLPCTRAFLVLQHLTVFNLNSEWIAVSLCDWVTAPFLWLLSSPLQTIGSVGVLGWCAVSRTVISRFLSS